MESGQHRHNYSAYQHQHLRRVEPGVSLFCFVPSFFFFFFLSFFPILCAGFPLLLVIGLFGIVGDCPIENRDSNICIMEGCMSIGV